MSELINFILNNNKDESETDMSIFGIDEPDFFNMINNICDGIKEITGEKGTSIYRVDIHGNICFIFMRQLFKYVIINKETVTVYNNYIMNPELKWYL